MFDPLSRYFTIGEGTIKITDPDGNVREIAYKRRRFVPQPGEDATLAEHVVEQGDRLDTITARYLGDPMQFWRICDANLELSPLDLSDEPGETITIPLPTH